MPIRIARTVVLIVLAALSVSGCSGVSLIKQYEYEEEIYLSLDGSATVYVNASVPALVGLRGMDLPVGPVARLDRARVRDFYEAPGCRVTRVSTSRRRGRRFVHLRLEVDDIRQLPTVGPFSWSRYRLDRQGPLFVFKQTIGAPAGRPVGDVGWRGDELVAFRVHLPSRIVYHDAPSRRVERGNILVWEQPLSERLAGRPLDIEARMETESILYRTLWLFALCFVAAAAAFGAVIWWVARRGGVAKS